MDSIHHTLNTEDWLMPQHFTAIVGSHALWDAAAFIWFPFCFGEILRYLPGSVNYAIAVNSVAMRSPVRSVTGTRGRRRRFSMRPIVESADFTPAGLPSMNIRL